MASTSHTNARTWILVALAVLAAVVAMPSVAQAVEYPQPVLGDTYAMESSVTAMPQAGCDMSIDGFTFDNAGYLWTVENDWLNLLPGSSRLVKRTANGTFIRTYGQGTAPGDLWYAAAVELEPNSGYLYVADGYKNRIAIFNPGNGKFIGEIGGTMVSTLSTITDEPYGFDVPTDLVFDSNGFLYVTDQNNHRVMKYNQAHVFQTAMGIVGGSSGTEGFSYPFGISVSPDGSLAVADSGNNRVQFYSAAGGYLGTLRPQDGPDDALSYPLDVQVDAWDVAYVVDRPNWSPWNGGRFTRWGDQGDFLGEYGLKPGGGSLDRPTSIDVDTWGTVWVTDKIADATLGAMESWVLNPGPPDLVPPVTTSNAPLGWARGPLNVTLSSTDASSPVIATYYSTDESTPTVSYATSPTITFSVEGTSTLKYYSIDRPGNEETITTQYIRIDNTAPETTSTALPLYYGTANISFIASDTLSGVSDTWWTIDGSLASNASQIIVSQQGWHTISYWTEDNAGNRETTRWYTFKVEPPDSDPPVTYWAEYRNDWFKQNTNVTLVATDTVSGVAATYYRINGSPITTYTGQFLWSTEGTHSLEYWSVDNLGHEEVHHNEALRLDRTKPYSSANVPVGAIGSATVTFAATDTVSGVAFMEYRIGAGEWTQGWSAHIPTYGDFTLYHRAIDTAGNAEDAKLVAVHIDQPDYDPPVTTSNIPPTGWVPGAGTANPYVLTFFPTDDISGVDYTLFSMDGGPWQEWISQEATTPPDGIHSVQWYSVDNQENVEATRTATLKVDSVPPSTTDNAQPVYAGPATISLTATDNLSPTTTKYRLDGAFNALIGNTIQLNEYRNYTIEYWSVDDAGNEELPHKTINVSVNPPDITPPTTYFSGPAGWQKGSAQFSLTATDTESPIKNTWYSTDSINFNPYYSPVTVSAQGTTTVSFYSYDFYNNKEDTKTAQLRVDSSPPVTTSDAVANYTEQAVITLAPTDPYSGVNQTFYRVNGGAWVQGTQATILWSRWRRTHTLEWYSTDNVNNIEGIKSATFDIRLTSKIEHEDNANIVYRGTWDFTTNTNNVRTNEPGAFALIAFQGTRLDLYTYVNDFYGKARVSLLDTDLAPATIDLYNNNSMSGQLKWTTGDIDFGDYIVKIEWLGEKNSSSSNTTINFDYVRVEGSVVQVPDSAAPVTTDDAPSGWVNGPVTVSLASTDATTGVKAIYATSNGATPTVTDTYTAPFAISAEGATTLKYYAVDNRGNAETLKTKTVQIDDSAPVTTSNALSSYTTTASIALLRSDGYSGVAYTQWRLDGGTWATGTAVTVPSDALGEHLLEWYSVDNIGNTETTRSASFTMLRRYEQTDPAVYLRGTWSVVTNASHSDGSFKSASTAGAASYVTFTGTQIDWIAPKNTSYGKANVSLDGGAPVEVDLYGSLAYKQKVWSSGIIASGTHTLRVECTGTKNAASSGYAIGVDAFDVVGALLPDAMAPVTTDDASSNWRTTPATVTLTAQDANTWVTVTQYRLNGAAPSAYSGPFVVSGEGTTTIQYASTDAAGNVEATKTATVRIDRAAPDVTADGPAAWTSSPATVTLSATDAGSGVASILYSTDGSDPTIPYITPISVSTPGTTTVRFRGIDALGNTSTIESVDVLVDDDAPVSGDDAPAGWVDAPVDVTLVATDNVSGVAAITYKVDGGAEATYTAPINVATEGTTTIEYRSIDVKGNLEDWKSTTVRVDLTDPVTGDDAPTEWTSSPVSVTLEPTDAVSAVESTFYSLDGSHPSIPYTGPVVVTAQGTTELKFFSADLAGNAEPAQSRTIRIDDVAPVTTDDAPAGWASSPVTVTLSVEETTSGTQETRVVLDSVESVYAAPIVIAEEGTHTLEYASRDVKGNVEETKTATVRIDDTAPTSTDDAPTGWVSGPVLVTLSPADPVSGVDAVLYSLDGSEPSIPYTAPIVIAAQGVTTLKYRAIDVKGNLEDVRTTTVSIDDVAPVTTDDAPAGWVNGPVDVSLSATDPVSGVLGTVYRIDGGAETTYTAPINVATEGTTTIEYRAIDVKGNIEEWKSTTVLVDVSDPVTGHDAPVGWVSSPVFVTLTPADAVSGVAATYYSLDGSFPALPYTAPVLVSAEGTTTVKYFAVDQAGNAEPVATVFVCVDDSAPAVWDDAPTNWQTSSVTVQLFAFDAYSGVSNIYSSTVATYPGTPYTGGLTVTGEGTTTISYRAEDALGRTSAISTATVRIDTIAPSTTDNATFAWAQGPASITLVATDAMSGVESVKYSLDGQDEITYTSPVAVSGTGTHTIEYRALDVAGNSEVVHAASIRLDSTAPTTTSNLKPSYATTASIALTRWDGHSGIAYTKYRLDGGAWTTGTALAVPPSAIGEHTLQYYSVDAVGNAEETVTANFAMVKRFEQDDSRVVYRGTWGQNSDSGMSGGSYKFSSTAGAASYIVFTGTRFDLIGAKGANYGILRVSVDGAAPVDVDTYASSLRYKQQLWVSGTLPDGRHTVKIEVAGQKNPLSGGTTVIVDALDFIGTLEADTVPPVTTDDVSGAWRSTTATVTLSATDADMLVADTRYRVNGGSLLTYSGPFPVTTEGTTSIAYYSTDGAGNAESTKTATVRIDRTGPTVSDDAPGTWIQGPVSVAILATDLGCGLGPVEHSLDGSVPSLPTSGPVLVSSEGTTTLKYRASDVLGNESTTVSKLVRIDNSDPVTSDGAPVGWLATPAAVTLSASDSLSGLSATMWALDGGEPTVYAAPIVVSDEGTHTLEYWSIDTAGNEEQPRSAVLRVDTTAPNTTDDAPVGWVEGPVTLNLSSSDAVSSVQATYFSTDGSFPTVPYTEGIVLSAEGTTTLRYYSLDAAGNAEPVKTCTVRIDDSAPTVSAATPSVWQRTPFTVELDAQDSLSGLDSVLYSVDGTYPSSPYTGAILIGTEGTTTISYLASDLIGHVSQVQQVLARLDTNAPSSSDNASSAWTTGSALVSIATSDAVSGIAGLTYQLDSGEVITYSSPIPVSGDGTHTLLYRAADVAGNVEVTRTATVRLDNTPPTTSSNAQAASYAGTATVTLTPSDAGSGVLSTHARLDGGSWAVTSTITVPGSSVGTHTLEWYSIDSVGNREETRTATIRAIRRFEQDDAMMSFTGTWSQPIDALMTGGRARFSSVGGTYASFAFDGTSIDWIGPKGPSYGTARIIIDDSIETTVDLYAPSLLYKQVVWSSGPLSSGRHTVRIECLGVKGAGSSTGVTIDALDVVGTLTPTRFEQDVTTLSYSGTWSQNASTYCSGGSYKFSSVTSSSVEYTFWGKSVDLVAIKGTSYGIARVSVDGADPVNVDFYSPSLAYRQTVWTSGTLTDGVHTVRVEVSGLKNPSSTGTGVAVDSFDIVGYPTPTRFEQDDKSASYTGTWSLNSDSGMSGGSYSFSSVPSSTVDLAFWGRSFDLIAAKGAAYGIAKVSIDGSAPVEVDLYNPTLKYRQAVWNSGLLSEGRHTVRIEVSGTKNPSSSGTGVTIDGFDVVGGVTARRHEQDYYMLGYSGTWTQNSDSGMSGSTYRFSSVPSSTVDLAFWGRSFEWLGAKGASYGIASVSIDGGVPTLVDLYSATLKYRQSIFTSGLLADGRHTVRIEVTGTKNVASGGFGIIVDAIDIAGYVIPRRFEQGDYYVSYTGTWGQNSDAGMSGGSYKHSATAGSTLNVAFSGTGIAWLTPLGPNYGLAAVSVDGAAPTIVDLYSPSLKYRQTAWSMSGLADGAHSLSIEVLGQRNPSASGTTVIVDAFDVVHGLSARRYDQTDGLLSWGGTWAQNNDAGMFGGSYRVSSVTSSTVVVSFTGKSIDWIGPKGASYGIARVTLDNNTPVNVDCYSSTLKYRQAIWSSGTLADGPHQLTIQVTGTKNPSSAGTSVLVDAFDIVGAVIPRDLTAPVTTSDVKPLYSDAATVTLSGLDAGIGVQSTTYRLDTGAWTTGTVVTTSGTGDHVLEFYSTDKAGNVETAKTATYTVLARTEEGTAAALYTGSWSTSNDSGASGGAYRSTTATGAAVEIDFTGTRIDWIALTGSGFGIARVVLDGLPVANVDLYSSSILFKQRVWSSGTVGSGTHTLRIEYTGTKNASAAGTRIAVDAFDVNGVVLP